MRLCWTQRARDDLFSIGRYIARHDSRAARSWIARLRKRARGAAETPLAGRVVPEMGRKDVREVFLKSYRIVYRVRRNSIEVLTIFEGHRRFLDGVLRVRD